MEHNSFYNEKVRQDILQFWNKLYKGLDKLSEIQEIEIANSKRDLVATFDRVKLYRYKALTSNVHKVPMLIVYALVNRNSMLDLYQGKSLINALLKQGLDVYIIDWGDPTRVDQFLTISDHIDGYLNDCVDFICEQTKNKKINLFGVCQGGTFSTIYSALYPNKVNTLTATVTPIDFDHQESMLNVWAKQFDIEALVSAYGNVSGNFMNMGYQMLKPFVLNVQKYMDLVQIMDDNEKLSDFMRMEKWIFDSPDQPGQTFKEFLLDFYRDNLLAQNKYKLAGRAVLLKDVVMPLMVVYAEKDHLVPPCSAKPLYELAGSKDKKIVSLPVGHIGLYVSAKTQSTLPALVADWVKKY